MSRTNNSPPQSENSAPVSLSDHAQLSETASSSERLQVHRGEGAGVVYIERGAVVHAELGELSGREAAQAIFQHAEASTESLSFAEPPERTMAVRPSRLLRSFAVENDELTRNEVWRRSQGPDAELSGSDPELLAEASATRPAQLELLDLAEEMQLSESSVSAVASQAGSRGSENDDEPSAGVGSEDQVSASGDPVGPELANPPGRTLASTSPVRRSVAPQSFSGSRDQVWLIRAVALSCLAAGLSFLAARTFRAPPPKAAQVVAPVVVEADLLTGLTDVMPRLIKAPPPAHPDTGSALRPTVLCRVLVGPEGLVEEASVLHSRTEIASYEAAALGAVRTYRFKPAQRSGQVVSAWLTVPVSFVGTVKGVKRVALGGSRGLSRLTKALEQQFALTGPESSIKRRMDGAAPCVAGLLEGTVDICLNTRPLNTMELEDAKVLGVEFEEHLLGETFATLVVHPENPVQALELGQLSALYRGRYKSWTELGGEDSQIQLVGTTVDSVAADAVRTSSLTSGGAPEEFFPQLKEFRETEEMFAYVARTRGAVAFAQTQEAAAQLAAAKDSVKVLWVGVNPESATLPDEAALHNGRYPVRSQLFAFSRASRSQVADRFLQMLLSVSGRRVTSLNDVAVGPRVRLPAWKPDVVAPSIEVFHVEFIAGSIGLDVPARLRLDEVALKLAQSEKRWAILVGNADPISEPTQHVQLAQKRAEAAERYLTSGGLGMGRVEVRSAGGRRPRSGAADNLSQHQNRRVDVFVVER